MNNCPTRATASSRIISGALAYLSMHLDSACPRSAYLAALLLGRIADDPGNDAELRAQAPPRAHISHAGTAHSPHPPRGGGRRAVRQPRPGACASLTSDSMQPGVPA
jgi:hypothetical protein